MSTTAKADFPQTVMSVLPPRACSSPCPLWANSGHGPHALAASLLSIGKSPTKCGKPERIFADSQLAIANDIV